MAAAVRAFPAHARYAVLGSPIAHSLSPAIQLAAFQAAKIPATYEAWDVPIERLEDAVLSLRQLRYAGWNATTPLKEAILPHLDALTVEARDATGVSVVRREDDGRLTGHNTDGAGLVRAVVELWGWRPEGARILVLGSGPAARAVVNELRRLGVADIFCWSRNAAKAAALARPPDQRVNLIISALPGSAEVPDELVRWMAPDCAAVDLNYAAARSPLDKFPVTVRSDGRLMLLHQAALSFEWWTGQPAPLHLMRKEIERK